MPGPRLWPSSILITVLALVGLAPAVYAPEDDVAEAMEAINAQIQTKPKDPQAYLQRSHLFVVSKKFDQAIADLDQANRLQTLPQLDREKAAVYLAAGWHETGLEYINRFLAKNTADTQGLLLRARFNTKLGRMADAGRDYEAALQQMPPSLELYLEHARALTTEDGTHLPLALRTLEQGIKRLGSIVTLETAALEIELRQRNYNAAITRVDRLIDRMPTKHTWLAKRGDIFVQAGKVAEARKSYQDALAAISKLPPRQRQLAPTLELEKQLKSLVDTAGELTARSAVAPTTLLTSRPLEPPQLVVPPAPTNTPSLPPGGKTRTYYIAAEEIEWDYAPAGNVIQEPFCGDPDAIPGRTPGRIGSRYLKALYREYTDGTFQRLKLRDNHWRHLGILGPLLRVEVGDRIKVVFKNKTRFPVSLHPHGVFYLKTSEGSGYNDSTGNTDKKDDGVPPGDSLTYDWLVPERAGPGPSDPTSLVWLYHSHVHAAQDANAGLIGAIVVVARGKAKPDGTPQDVDRELVTLFNIFNENQSWLYHANLKTYLPKENSVQTNDLAFIESNMKHSINGFIFGNLPIMTIGQGERVRWYLLGMGSEADLHTAHWHANNVLYHGHRTDVVELLPASMKVADMVADNPGLWMFHCHVSDHMVEGMSARYQVLAR
jgi:tetratricopeptide (TPR) repeat protein